MAAPKTTAVCRRMELVSSTQGAGCKHPAAFLLPRPALLGQGQHRAPGEFLFGPTGPPAIPIVRRLSWSRRWTNWLDHARQGEKNPGFWGPSAESTGGFPISPRMARIQQGWRRWTVAVHATLGQIAPSQVLPRGGWRRRLWGFWGSGAAFGVSDIARLAALRFATRDKNPRCRPGRCRPPIRQCQDVKASTQPMMALHPAAIPVQPEVGIEHRSHEPHLIQNAERRWDGVERNGDDGAVWGPNSPQ
jgi:hypothetical protein